MKKVTFLICVLITTSDAIPIDNGIEGVPEVDCTSDSITVNFNTHNTFEGSVSVKGAHNRSACRSTQTGQPFSGITIPFDGCNVIRTRSLNPRGVYLTTTVIISFHPQFVTKIDRAYRIQCFYMEADKTVSTQIDVSDMSTIFQTRFVPMPICRYEILGGGPGGAPVSFAVIGQQVYHKWSCETETLQTFCMLVHSCIVDDGKGDTVRILDSEGCAIDRHLLNNLEYPSDLTAGQEAHVYKYADRSHMFYQCQISVTIKERNFECVRPKCAEPKGYGAKKSRNVKSVSSTDGYHAKIASTGNLSVSNSETSRLSPLSALVKRSAKIDQPENIWDVSADFEALDIFDMDSSQQFDLNRNLLSVYHYPTITIKATTDSTCLPFSSILILIFLIFLPSTFSAVFFILVRKYKKTLKTRRL